MNISSAFNRFYHRAVLTELFRRCDTLRFTLWVDDKGGVFEFIKGEDFNDMDDLKQLLKNMNLDYEVEGEDKVSTADIDSTKLMQHIEWCIALAGENNITFGFIEDEWDRLLNDTGVKI